MLTDKLKELEALRDKAAKLEAAVAEELKSQLKNLPSEYGFADAEAFIAAVRQATGGRGRTGRGGVGNRVEQPADYFTPAGMFSHAYRVFLVTPSAAAARLLFPRASANARAARARRSASGYDVGINWGEDG